MIMIIWLEISPQISMDFAFAIHPNIFLQIFAKKIEDNQTRNRPQNRPC